MQNVDTSGPLTGRSGPHASSPKSSAAQPSHRHTSPRLAIKLTSGAPAAPATPGRSSPRTLVKPPGPSLDAPSPRGLSNTARAMQLMVAPLRGGLSSTQRRTEPAAENLLEEEQPEQGSERTQISAVAPVAQAHPAAVTTCVSWPLSPHECE